MTLKLQACLQVVEHVGDSTREGEHDDKEGDEEHPNVLHHGVDTENDRAEVLGGDPDLDHLDDGQGERHPPQDPSRGFEVGDVEEGLGDHVLQHLDQQSNQEKQVHHNVVVVPESEISFLESPHFWTWTLKAPEKEGCPKISQTKEKKIGLIPIMNGKKYLYDVMNIPSIASTR